MTRARWIPRLTLGVLAASLVVAARSDGAVFTRERVEISAPILPDVLVLYKYQPLPPTLEGEQAVAHEAALTYERLLPECAPDYPAITLTPTTSAQLAANYNAVADCSYEKHTAKPYWPATLITDVDICGTELGDRWRLISEDDIASLTEDDFQFIQNTLTPVAAAAPTSDLGPWYFGLQIFVRLRDGTVGQGSLEPGVVGNRVAPFGGHINFVEHYVVPGVALRCIRRTDVP